MNTYLLHPDGPNWSLRHSLTHREVARFQCRKAALRESLAHAHGHKARLVLVPGTKRTH